jgi:mannose-1-phosphate guanylyltransferase
VLTAGVGSRLRPLSEVRAKPAVPVAGQPMIRRIIRGLASQGVDRLVLNLHHLPETITAVVGDGSDCAARVQYSWEQPRILGSGGGPRLALPLVGGDPFLIVNGDTITDFALSGLVDEHTKSGAVVTLALIPNREFERYGGVRLDDQGRVMGFVSRGPSAQGSYHFIGIQIAHSAAFEGVAAGQAARTIGGVYDTLIATRPGSVRGFVCDARFWDVGTIEDYWRTSQALAEKEPFSACASTGHGNHIGRGGHIDSSARVMRSILWDDVVVEAGAELDECIVADRVHIPVGARYQRAVLVRDSAADKVIAVPRDRRGSEHGE